jgi:hypothetical protein
VYVVNVYVRVQHHMTIHIVAVRSVRDKNNIYKTDT